MRGGSSNGSRMAPWPPYVLQILERLESAGYDVHVVGGCVRDRLLGRTTHDYDIATSALPQEVGRLFARTVPTGIKHGTVTVLEFGEAVEVTTYRRDGKYSDGRHPDSVAFSDSVEVDLARRDFTINAMAMTARGQLIDPYHGLDDLHRHSIRAVGVAVDRFQEDALRILRALRFCAELGFSLHPDTERAMAETSAALEQVSMERIGQEFKRLLTGDWPRVIPQLAHGPYLLHLSPPWPLLRAGFSRLLADGWTSRAWLDITQGLDETWHSIEEAYQRRDRSPMGIAPRFILALTLLSVTGDVPVGHMQQICKRAAWGRENHRILTRSLQVVQDDPVNWSPSKWRTTLFSTDPFAVLTGCCCLDALHAVAANLDARSHRPRVRTLHSLVLTQPLWGLHDLAVNGQDMVDLGVNGPLIGSLLWALADAVLNLRLQNTRSDLLTEAKRRLKGQPGEGGDPH